MRNKFLLPVLAAIFAIGMSFTTINEVSDLNTDYILQEGELQPIGMEFNCGTGTIVCQAKSQDETFYDVYDTADSQSPKRGNGTVHNLPW